MQKRVSKGKHGSSLSESNHSSVLVFLNDGESQFNLYCESPFTLVKDLFRRQKTCINKFNEVLHNQKLKLDIEKRILSQTTHVDQEI